MSIVPIPSFWFKGIQKIKTETLNTNVINPTENPDFKEIPCAKTDQGDAPEAETINKPSPKPNKINPKQRKKMLKFLVSNLVVYQNSTILLVYS